MTLLQVRFPSSMTSSVTSLSILLLLLSSSSARYNNSNFYWRTPPYAMPWLKGPNVCAVEEVVGSRSRYHSECMTYMPRSICEKPTFVRYHCCTGFEKTGTEEKGCEGVAPVENLWEQAKHLYLADFRKHATTAGLDTMLQDQGAFTVFAPHNKGFRILSQKKKNRLKKKNKVASWMKNHISRDRHLLHTLVDGRDITTMAQGSPVLRINRYSNGVVTVNCARIVVPDQIATNGVIHITEKVIDPIQDKGTIMDFLLKDDEFEFGELATALIVTQLGNRLRDDNEVFTLFAPTDAAFRNAPEDVVERILSNKDDLERLLRYHILDRQLCLAAVLGRVSLTTLEGQRVNLTCDVNDNIQANGKRIIKSDIVTKNGVIHVLDEILVPDTVKTLTKVISDLDALEFLEFAQAARIMDILEGKEDGNFTVFVPSQEAFDKLSANQRRLLLTQPAAAQKVFKYHIAPGSITTNSIVGHHSIAAATGHNDKLHLSVEQGGYSINGAKIVSPNHRASNGIVHIIDTVLLPPEDNAIDKVKAEPQLSTFLSLLQSIGLDNLLLDVEGNFTVFAPVNDAFDALQSVNIDRLASDPEELAKFVQYHILQHPVYTNTMQERWQYRYKTLTDHWLKLKKIAVDGDHDQDGATRVLVDEHSEAVEGPIMATNGVIYLIDEVLECPCIEPIINGHGFEGGASTYPGGKEDQGHT